MFPVRKRTGHFLGGARGKGICLPIKDVGFIAGLGKSPGGGHGNLLQYSCL